MGLSSVNYGRVGELLPALLPPLHTLLFSNGHSAWPSSSVLQRKLPFRIKRAECCWVGLVEP